MCGTVTHAEVKDLNTVPLPLQKWASLFKQLSVWHTVCHITHNNCVYMYFLRVLLMREGQQKGTALQRGS